MKFSRQLTGEWCITPEGLRASRAQDYQPMCPEFPDPEDGSFTRAGKVAVVQINGILGKNLDPIETMYLGGVDYDELSECLTAADADPITDTVLLHIRSPGGMALGAMESGDKIASLSKPTVAYSDFLMCSGGYWLGSQCDALYSSFSAMLGSIGVMAAYVDQSEMLKEMGIRVNAFSAGKWKTAGASWKPMSDAEKAMFQARVERYYAQFVAAVNNKRSIDPAQCEGQVFDGDQAVAAGLSDGIYPCLDDLLIDLNK